MMAFFFNMTITEIYSHMDFNFLSQNNFMIVLYACHKF